jgi:hypothetical protein
MESSVTAPVSGHIKRVVVHEGKKTRVAAWLIVNLNLFSLSGDSINQGDLVVDIMH